MNNSEGQTENIGSSTGSTNTPIESEVDAPLWRYVTKLEKQGKGGTWKFQCNFCSEVRQGSYYRVRAHLLGLKNAGVSVYKKVPRTEILAMKKLEDDFEKKKNESGPKEVSLPCEVGSAYKKRKSDVSPIVRAFGIEARDQLDQEIARMFFTGGLAFNLAVNPHYRRSYQFAAANKLDGYVPPGYNMLRTTLLEKQKNHVEKLLDPLKLTWKERGVTIVSDGWSDPTKNPLINFIATSGNGHVFLKAVNCFDHTKILNEYALFSMKSGPFEDLTCISAMYTMEPKNWWANFGAQTPLLQTLAFKLLGQPTSSSCAERNWSTYSFIHSLKRNKLNPSRAQDLVYIHNNLRLLSRNTDEYKDEKTKMWDVGGDGFDSMEDVGFLEFSDLSLDEPDFENPLLY